MLPTILQDFTDTLKAFEAKAEATGKGFILDPSTATIRWLKPGVTAILHAAFLITGAQAQPRPVLAPATAPQGPAATA